ncbi:hypothetical protein ACJRO7_025999 [Eucalyptus globulus]|uniref:Uncharacterized protein n=1 Tax=Eucalyptus globulus TaxID=34317 RepID=A0ABD3KAW7_EUCGL
MASSVQTSPADAITVPLTRHDMGFAMGLSTFENDNRMSQAAAAVSTEGTVAGEIVEPATLSDGDGSRNLHALVLFGESVKEWSCPPSSENKIISQKEQGQ